ncbi:MAG: hypothetical protein WCP14_02550 [bacterium]
MKRRINLLIVIAVFLSIFPLGTIAHAYKTARDPGSSNPFYKGCTELSTPGISGVEMVTCITSNIFDIFLGVTLTAATLAVVMAGIMYMTSAGDANRATTAKKYLTYIFIAIAVIAGSKLLVSFAGYLATLFT